MRNRKKEKKEEEDKKRKYRKKETERGGRGELETIEKWRRTQKQLTGKSL